jgi:hypothetical protein
MVERGELGRDRGFVRGVEEVNSRGVIGREAFVEPAFRRAHS